MSDLIPILGKSNDTESIKQKIADNVKSVYAINAIMEYYQAISETQIESHDLADLTRQIQNNAPDWGKMEIGSLEDMKEQTIKY